MERRRRHERVCEACGVEFLASRKDARYCSATCRRRASRATMCDSAGRVTDPRAAVTDSVVTDPPDPLDAEPGRCRAGLEAPLHGRFTTALAALAETVDGRAADEAAVVHRQLRGGCSVPGHKFGPLHCVWCCQPGTVPATVSQLAHGAASDSQPFQADASDFM